MGAKGKRMEARKKLEANHKEHHHKYTEKRFKRKEKAKKLKGAKAEKRAKAVCREKKAKERHTKLKAKREKASKAISHTENRMKLAKSEVHRKTHERKVKSATRGELRMKVKARASKAKMEKATKQEKSPKGFVKEA